MAYRVKVSPSALADAEQTYLWIKEHRSEEQATRWYNGLVDAVYSLEELPTRCPLAPESKDLGRELHQLLYGKRSAAHRILFALVLDKETGEEVVRVYRIWPGARDRITASDIEEE